MRIHGPNDEVVMNMAEDPRGLCPPWIDDLTEAVGHCIETGLVPVAYDVWGPDEPDQAEDLDDPWEVHFYPSVSELVGGPKDGALIYPGLSVDVLGLLESFEDIEDLSWSSRSRNREPRYDGAVLDLLGWYTGHPVRLRIFDEPPDDATVDSVIEHRSGRLRPKDPP
jgi:hypothetical protein